MSKLNQHMHVTSPEIPVESILQMVEQGQLTGVLQATAPEGGATVYIRVHQGMIVKAISNSGDWNSTRAVDAVNLLLMSKSLQIQFRVVPGVPNGDSRSSITGLLMTCAAAIDESAGADNRIQRAA